MKYEFEIKKDDPFIGERIDKYVSEQINELSRSRIQMLIDANLILVNDDPCKSNHKLRPQECISVQIPKPEESNIEAEDISLDILYEDEDVLVVNKPKGMVVHPAAGHFSGTLVNALMYHCKDNLSGINGILRPGIVHRIDADTTGALIVCKNDFSHNCIAEQLREHSITRRYWAIVEGVLEEDGTIHAPIGRHPIDRKKMAVNYRNGKDAITHYHVIKNFEKYTLIECRLETGRTHQIRVHMASINHPLLGDHIYNPHKCSYKQLKGQCLHAKIIGFIHPRTGEYMEFEAPLPDYFTKLLKNMK